MKDLGAPRFTLPLDSRGNVAQTGAAAPVEVVTLSTTQVREIAVPPDAVSAMLWAVATGAATTIAWKFGGAQVGAPASLAAVVTNQSIAVPVAEAPAIYAQAVGAAADLNILWYRKAV